MFNIDSTSLCVVKKVFEQETNNSECNFEQSVITSTGRFNHKNTHRHNHIALSAEMMRSNQMQIISKYSRWSHLRFKFIKSYCYSTDYAHIFVCSLESKCNCKLFPTNFNLGIEMRQRKLVQFTQKSESMTKTTIISNNAYI